MPTTVPTREVYWNIQGIWIMYALVVVMTIVFTAGAIVAYDPARGLIARRGGGG